ncbi:hypothetical protein AALH12_04530 [Streptococcus ferus]|uniref:hypothetical protein n=1 Tax=Streptococcus ferus TaxID=1345 RepID=UPI00351754C9
MRKRLSLLLVLFLGGIVIMTGCRENKNSRQWIENKVSAVSRVYPTEDLFDLFKEFPEGFEIYQEETAQDEGISTRVEITIIGEAKTKKIEGVLKKILVETNPYSEEILMSIPVTYKNGQFNFSDEDNAQEIWRYGGFLFQKLSLSKEYLSNLKYSSKSYDSITTDYDLTYKMKNKEIQSFFNLAVTREVNIEISGSEANDQYGYKHSLLIRKDPDIYNFRETVSTLEENKNAE